MLPDGSRPPIWFTLDETRPLAFFAGIWTPWTSVRKVKEGETTNDLFAFLTIEPNALIGTYHPKAMPVILTTQEEIDLWMKAPTPEAPLLSDGAPWSFFLGVVWLNNRRSVLRGSSAFGRLQSSLPEGSGCGYGRRNGARLNDRRLRLCPFKPSLPPRRNGGSPFRRIGPADQRRLPASRPLEPMAALRPRGAFVTCAERRSYSASWRPLGRARQPPV